MHEAVDISIINSGGKILDSEIPLHHYGLLKGKDVVAQKRKKYLALGLEQIKVTPNNPRPHYEVGKVYLARGELDKAIEHLSKVIALKPRYMFAYTNLGDAYRKKGDLAQAKAAYTRSISLKPHNENAYINLAMILYDEKKVRQSFQLFSKALQINSLSVPAYLNLGNLLVRQKKYLPEKETFTFPVQM